jgi:hypothetical protein
VHIASPVAAIISKLTTEDAEETWSAHRKAGKHEFPPRAHPDSGVAGASQGMRRMISAHVLPGIHAGIRQSV